MPEDGTYPVLHGRNFVGQPARRLDGLFDPGHLTALKLKVRDSPGAKSQLTYHSEPAPSSDGLTVPLKG